MGQIQILGQNMVNMIAAGEVIERPASVVKELVENSIDSGATKITITVEDGGRKLITVSDNGSGMDAEDLAMAFEPHATSKVRTESDLQKIATFGFRGEALASIAAVANVKAVSRSRDSLTGWSLEIDCGSKGDAASCGGDYGTTIQVRDIFYKLPARRKFLKTANTELDHIIEGFTRIALANPEVEMTLASNKRELFRLGTSDKIVHRIGILTSTEIADNLIEAETTDEKTGLHIYALLGRPQVSRTNNKLQYIFINGRFIRDKFISHAIREAYRGLIEEGRFPIIFLFLRMPYEDYDVNVHPTKIEVRFYNSNYVYSQILSVLREKLLAEDHGIDARLPQGQPRSGEISDAMADFFKKYRLGDSQRNLGFRPAVQPAGFSPTSRAEQVGYERFSRQRNFIQIRDSFIIAETDDGFIVIDQHALHERIMYENLRSRLQKGSLESQKLLIPESLEITAGQDEVIKNNEEIFQKLGIELTSFGPKTIAVQAFPALLAKATPVEFVKDLIDLLSEKCDDSEPQILLDKVLNLAACKAAVKAGQKLNDNEIEQLLSEREQIETSGRCPHGRPTAIKFSYTELEKQFKRT